VALTVTAAASRFMLAVRLFFGHRGRSGAT
jgi:hypothetical protein